MEYGLFGFCQISFFYIQYWNFSCWIGLICVMQNNADSKTSMYFVRSKFSFFFRIFNWSFIYANFITHCFMRKLQTAIKLFNSYRHHAFILERILNILKRGNWGNILFKLELIEILPLLLENKNVDWCCFNIKWYL